MCLTLNFTDMINISNLKNKTANHGMSAKGKLAAGEWNTLVEATEELQTVVSDIATQDEIDSLFQGEGGPVPEDVASSSDEGGQDLGPNGGNWIRLEDFTTSSAEYSGNVEKGPRYEIGYGDGDVDSGFPVILNHFGTVIYETGDDGASVENGNLKFTVNYRPLVIQTADNPTSWVDTSHVDD